MLRSIYLIFFPLYLISATLTINVAKDNNETFTLIHLDDIDQFLCKKEFDQSFKDQIICTLKRTITQREHPIEDRFFKIYFYDKRVVIVPKENFNLYNYSDNFIDETNISTNLQKPSKHWVIVGYNKNRLFSRLTDDALNFDITFYRNKKPFIGELDFNLLPISDAKEAKLFNSIKKSYQKKEYDIVINKCDDFLHYPTNEFTQKVYLYKLKAMDKILSLEDSKELDPMEFANLAQTWLDNNPSDINFPEVLSFLAKTYIKMNRQKEANRYIEKLKILSNDGKYYFLAKLFKADKLYKAKRKREALKEYRDVLYNTKNFDIASMAAMKLSNIYLDQKNPKKASLFMDKIIKANPNFLQQNKTLCYNLAKKFSENNNSNIAIKLSSYFKDSKNLDQDELLKNLGYWSEKAGKYSQAISLYKKYIKKFPDGKYIEFVKKHLDQVLLNTDENNQTKRLLYLDDMIKKYQGKALAKKALIEKTKILIEQKQFDEILKKKDEIIDAGGKELIKEVASRVIVTDLNKSRCNEAILLKNEYNITIDSNLLPSLYNCYKKLNKNTKAIQIAKILLKKSKNIDKKLQYMYDLIKLYKKVGNYKTLLLVANVLQKLAKTQHNQKYNDICLDSIEAYYQIGGLDTLMLKEAKRCENLLKEDVRLLDIYDRVLEYAKRRDDPLLIATYAKKIVSLQKKYNISDYSPIVDIDLIEALRESKKYKEALKYDLDLLYKKLDDEQKAHILYLAGYLSEKLGKRNDAKEFYSKCGAIVKNSAWVGLCSENLQLLQE